MRGMCPTRTGCARIYCNHEQRSTNDEPSAGPVAPQVKGIVGAERHIGPGRSVMKTVHDTPIHQCGLLNQYASTGPITQQILSSQINLSKSYTCTQWCLLSLQERKLRQTAATCLLQQINLTFSPAPLVQRKPPSDTVCLQCFHFQAFHVAR